jgi:hypothetical protein
MLQDTVIKPGIPNRTPKACFLDASMFGPQVNYSVITVVFILFCGDPIN